MTWQLPEYRMHPYFDPANPLLLLLTGPIDAIAIVNLARLYMTSLTSRDVERFMINLDEQNDAGCPVLFPAWWLGNPLAFRARLEWEILKPSFTRGKSLEEIQEAVLAEVVSVWTEQ